MKRLFAAIRITPDNDFMDQFHRLQEQLNYEKIKWVEDQNIHITLKFFGDTDERKFPEIITVLKRVSDQVIAFRFRLYSLAIFGSKYDPRVIWTGIEPYDSLVDLMKLVQEELKSIGYMPDRQNLVPHLTMGRIKFLVDKRKFGEVIDEFKEMKSEILFAENCVLYESILRKEGPVYLGLQTFPFKLNDKDLND